jgi:hypothetical protein
MTSVIPKEEFFMALSHFLPLNSDFIFNNPNSIWFSLACNKETIRFHRLPAPLELVFLWSHLREQQHFLIEALFVKYMIKRSIPIPIPDVGGIPYSKALNLHQIQLLHRLLLQLILIALQNVLFDQ